MIRLAEQAIRLIPSVETISSSVEFAGVLGRSVSMANSAVSAAPSRKIRRKMKVSPVLAQHPAKQQDRLAAGAREDHRPAQPPPAAPRP